ncbi:hypothetical protein C8R47DRAFT_1075127 [Mycena vitilis]|nr:hypothetical protein C8R47DRAFT_1075127 [Mycena vitilis]
MLAREVSQPLDYQFHARLTGHGMVAGHVRTLTERKLTQAEGGESAGQFQYVQNGRGMDTQTRKAQRTRRTAGLEKRQYSCACARAERRLLARRGPLLLSPDGKGSNVRIVKVWPGKGISERSGGPNACRAERKERESSMQTVKKTEGELENAGWRLSARYHSLKLHDFGSEMEQRSTVVGEFRRRHHSQTWSKHTAGLTSTRSCFEPG